MKQLWVRVPSHEDYPPASGHRKASPVEVLAAAATLDGAEVKRWCQTHDAESVENHRGMTDECWRVVWVDNGQGNPEEVPWPYDLCRIVNRLVIPLPDKETPIVDPDIAREAVETLINKPLRDRLPDKETTDS